MAINPYHTVEEINGVRCSVVEKKVSEERAAFVRKVLEFNKLNVQMSKAEDGTFIVGVDDIIFNAVHAVYNRSLKTPEGKVLTVAYWNQKQQKDQYYWNY
jgi:hypothetical protein